MKKYSLDPYVATRQAFYDYRRNLIKRSSDKRDIIFSIETTSVSQPVSEMAYLMKKSSRDM